MMQRTKSFKDYLQVTQLHVMLTRQRKTFNKAKLPFK